MVRGLATLIGIVVVNAIPLAGVLWFGWSVFEVLFLYWFENVAVGLAQVVRIVICTRTTGNPTGYATARFFFMHYGMFTFAHGVFVMTLFAPETGLAELGPGFVLPVLAIMGWQVAALFLDATRTEGFRERTPDGLMFEPYPRVLALHITVVAGGALIEEMGSPVWALALLVAVKTLVDVIIALVLSVGLNHAAAVAALRKSRD